jgi:hypothetical protein
VRAALLLLLAVGCGGARPPPVDPPAAEEAEAFEVAGVDLPPLPYGVEEADLEAGLALLESLLLEAPPEPPEGYRLEAWLAERLPLWVGDRARRLGALLEALEPARQGESEALAAVASALLGVAFERSALDLRGLPRPRGLGETRDAFDDALARLARPLAQRAIDAYGSCASIAAGAPAYSLSRWRTHCDEAAEALTAAAGAGDPPPDPPDEAP